jgi:hypothetical protein
MRTAHRPESEDKGFPLSLRNDLRQAAGNERAHGLSRRYQRRNSKETQQQKTTNEKHGLPTHTKTCKNSGKSSIANISLYKQQSRADSTGAGTAQYAAYRRRWCL